MNRKRIALGLFGGLLSEAVNKLFPLVTLHFAATRLGVTSYGASQFAMWITDLGIFIVMFGYGQWAPIAWHQKGENQKQVFSSVVTTRLLHALVGIGVLTLVVFCFPGWTEYRPLVLPCLFVVLTTALDATWALIALRQLPLFSLMSVIVRLASMVAIVFLVRAPDDGVLYVVVIQGANALLSIGSFFLVLRFVGWQQPSTQSITRAFTAALPFAVSMYLLVALERIDMALVERKFGPSGAGIYGGPQRIAQSLLPLATMITTVFFAEIIPLVEAESILRHLKAGLTVAVLCIAPVVAGVWFVDQDVVRIVLGDNFVPGAVVLSVLTLATSAQTLVAIFGYQILAVRGKIAAVNWSLALGLMTTICLTHFLAPMFGLTGAAAASAGGRWLAAIAVTAFALHYLGGGFLDLTTTMIKGVIPALTMTVALFFAGDQSFAIKILVGVTVYGAVGTIIYRALFMKTMGQLKQRFSGKPS